MTRHECVDQCNRTTQLAYCVDHPKWNVCHARSEGNVGRRWFAYAPKAKLPTRVFGTWDEAMSYARQEATR